MLQLAHLVQTAAARIGLEVSIGHLPDPRVEKEESDSLLDSLMTIALHYKDRIRHVDVPAARELAAGAQRPALSRRDDRLERGPWAQDGRMGADQRICGGAGEDRG